MLCGKQVFPGSSLAVFRGFACDSDFDFDKNYVGDTARAACGPTTTNTLQYDTLGRARCRSSYLK